MTSLTKCLYRGVFWEGNSSPRSDQTSADDRGSEPPTHINIGENMEPIPINGKHLIICTGQNIKNVVKLDRTLSFFHLSFVPLALHTLLNSRKSCLFGFYLVGLCLQIPSLVT